MHCHSTRHITSTAPQPCAGSALWLRIKVCATAAAQGSQEGHEPADSLAINQPATSPEALLSGLWIKLRRGEELEGTGPAAVGAGAVLGAALSNAAAASMGKAALRGGFGVDGGKKRWKKKKKTVRKMGRAVLSRDKAWPVSLEGDGDAAPQADAPQGIAWWGQQKPGRDSKWAPSGQT